MSGLTLNTHTPGTVGKLDNSGSVDKQEKVQSPPPLPRPGPTLEQLRQRFPDEPVDVLKGLNARVDMPARVQESLEQVRAQAPRRGQVAVLVGVGKQARVAYMPTAGVRGANPELKVREYVGQGKEIYDQIMTGAMPARNKQNVAKLMWYLQALGSAKAAESSGQADPALYREGAMFVEDRDGCLEAFLRDANSYKRASSHMRDYQRLGEDFQPRGVDIRNVETPNKRKTILFARLPQDAALPEGSPLKGTGDKRMLFLKMEPNGCRGLTAKGSGTPREEGVPPGKWKAFKRFFANIKDIFQHGLGFARSVAQRTGLMAVEGQDNRERIPAGVRNQYRQALDAVAAHTFPGISAIEANPIRQSLTQALERDNPLGDSAGIKQMLANIRSAVSICQRLYLPAGVISGLTATLTGLESAIGSRRDHPEMRIGNEVIVTRDETPPGPLQFSPVKPFIPGQTLYDQGALSPEGVAVLTASLQYGLDSNDRTASLVETFRADTNRCRYSIGQAGRMRTLDHDTNGSIQAIRELTGGDKRVGAALMALANQSLVADITTAAVTHSLNVSGIMIAVPPNAQGGEFNVIRLPDEGRGESKRAVYEVSYSSNIHPNSVLDGQGNATPLDQKESWMSSETKVRLTVFANGEMKVGLADAPRFSYRLSGQQEPGPNV